MLLRTASRPVVFLSLKWIRFIRRQIPVDDQAPIVLRQQINFTIHAPKQRSAVCAPKIGPQRRTFKPTSLAKTWLSHALARSLCKPETGVLHAPGGGAGVSSIGRTLAN